MPKCPYCNNEHVLEDFFSISTKETKKGKIKTRIEGFHGQELHIGFRNSVKMWTCPSCDTILGFSEYMWDSKM